MLANEQTKNGTNSIEMNPLLHHLGERERENEMLQK